MNNYKKLKELALFLICLILGIVIVKYLGVLDFLLSLCNVLTPVLVGFIYAWLLNPFINKLSEKYNRNFICIVLFLIIIFLLGLFIYLLIPTLYKEIQEIITIIPGISEKVIDKLKRYGLENSLKGFSDTLIKSAPVLILNLAKKFIKVGGVVGVGLILGLYLSMDYNSVISFIYSIVPKKKKCVFITVMQDVGSSVRKCVNGTLLVAFLVFVGDTLCFMFLKLEAPLLLGMFCGLTDLIPYIGPYIGGFLAVLVGFTEDKVLGLLTLGACIIVQSIENYVLQPLVMSKKIKISPVLIIIGLLVFGNLFGILGMILATPCVAMLKVLFEYIIDAKRKCKE